jgi:hypothetical protein
MISRVALLLILVNSAVAPAQTAEFSFSKKILKFESIREGTALSFEYPFTNIGSVPLIISDYHVQCSCTRVTYPKEPVLPGESGMIRVEFDSAGKIGWQYRTILLYANVLTGADELEFRVKVKPKE